MYVLDNLLISEYKNFNNDAKTILPNNHKLIIY